LIRAWQGEGSVVRLFLTVVDPYSGQRADTVIEASDQTPVGEIARELRQHVGAQSPAAAHMPAAQWGGTGQDQLYVDGAPVDPRTTLFDSPLREGALVSLNHPSGCLPPEPHGTVEVRVTCGPGAGAVHRLGIGRADIGSGQAVRIRLDDAKVPDRAAMLTVNANGACTLVPHNGTPLTLDGVAQPESGPVTWEFGSQLAVGDTLLELIPYQPPNAALRISEDGTGFDYNRPPRLLPPDRPTSFRLPREPKEREKRPLPWLMALLPIVGAVMMAMLRDRWIFLLIAFLSPVMVLGNFLMDRKKGRKSHATKMAEYRETRARIEKDAGDALRAESFARRHAAPDPATALTAASGPRTRLWERRRTDDDHLLLRVGTHDIDSEVVLDDPDQDEHRRKVVWKVPDAPVTVSLATHGVVGLAGTAGTSRAMGRWAVGQIAVMHSPVDVQLYVLTDNAAQQQWEWVRWLPHVRPTAGQDATAMIGTDAETVGVRIAELIAMLDARQEEKKKYASRTTFTNIADVVIVFDGSRRLRSLPGVIRLLREGPQVSMFSICLDEEERFLPEECKAVVAAESAAASASAGGWPYQQAYNAAPAAQGFAPPPAFGFGAAQPAAGGARPATPWEAHAQPTTAAAAKPDTLRVEQTGTDRLRGVRPDWVGVEWCELVARYLSPLRDISGESEDATLPTSSRLLDVLQLEPPSRDAVAARWRMGDQSTLAVIGESYDGAFGIDLRRDGPHGLIAGTTGAGKSELLQTIVASLAVANTPENMTFVLVDYKGGAAFKDCVNLPHTVGMVTDLDNHLVERALRSLGAELTRREHILAAVGTKDIEDYQDLRRREPGRHAAMPRLLIVIDEFASLARELPDFVKGLVNIAQRGRSLGIHLLLATQRPSGVVSPEIRANTNLRIALRVTDSSESNDVIKAPDSATIPKTAPGRAYARLGAASLVPFQSGRVGGRRPGTTQQTSAPPWSARLDWANLGRSRPIPPKQEESAEEEITDLKVLVDSISQAGQHLGIPAQHSPWLPPLPEKVLLSELPPAPRAAGSLPAVPYALEDLPDSQERRTLAIDLRAFGHLLVSGAPRTGRSQLLRTIAGSLASCLRTEDLHLYGIDCGNGALNILTRLPHCGAVVGRTQVDRAKRLIKRLVQEVERRQELLAAGALADISEQRAAAPPEERLPHIVVLLDRWEGWTTSLGEIDTGALTDDIYQLMREGGSAGVHFIVSGDRTVLAGRISSLSEDKYTFRLPDRTDYTAAGLPGRKMPEDIPPGRLYRAVAGTESHVAVLTDDLTGQAQAAAIAEIAEAATRRDESVPRARRPFRVDVLPARLTFADAWEMRDPASSDARLWALIGVGGDELTGLGPDLAVGGRAFIIAGPPKSGRSTLLRNIAETYLSKGVRLVISTPRRSPLSELEGREGVLRVLTGTKLGAEEVQEALASATPDDPVVMLMDDAEDLRRCDAGDELKSVITRGAERGTAIVLAGDAEEVGSGISGWQPEAKKARRGVLLSPRSHRHGDLIGAKLPRSAAVEKVQPGSGILHLGDGTPVTVKIPEP
jgi:DNA segregation ATPase FtsK/SpoIIIE, S-DNA-T family